MRESKIKNRDAKICMFWDVEDYPIPDGRDPCWMKGKIEKALKIQRFSGKLSIQAYVDKNKFSTELERKYLDADIKLCRLCEGSKYAKVNGMLVDVLFWAFENPAPANLIVLAKAVGETLPFSVLEGLHYKGYGVLSATIQRRRDTHVLWDMDSCESTIPENPFVFKQKIEDLIREEGYFGEISFWLVAYEKTYLAAVIDEYRDAGFLFQTEGDKDAVEHMMFADILFWAIRNIHQPGNLLVISENPNFGLDKFATIRRSMENKGFNVTVAPLDRCGGLQIQEDATSVTGLQ